MKRTLTSLTAALLFAASGVYAEAPAAPARPVASPFSPLVYDALGATPKIELRKAKKVGVAPAAPQAEAKRASSASGAGTVSHAAVPASAKTH